MMEINIEKLLESGMSPESIGKMVQLEAQKKQEKKKKNKADAEKAAAARTKVCEALWDYCNLMCPDETMDKNEFISIFSREISEFEDFITNPLMQQIFKQPTSRCSCKEQTSETQKCVKDDEWERMPGYKEKTLKVNVDELDDAAINKIIKDFARTLME